MVQGRCLCGAIEYTIDVPEQEMLNAGVGCHCNSCKISSSGSSHNLAIPTDKVSVTKGEPKEFTDTGSSGKPVRRFFCRDCGTPVFTNPDCQPGTSFVKVGALREFGNRVKMTSEAWSENANPNTLRPHAKHLDSSFKPIDVQV